MAVQGREAGSVVENYFLISINSRIAATEVAESALAGAPENAALLYAKGECLQNLGRIKEAEQAYLKVLKSDSSHAYAANNLATLYMNSGEYLKAAEYYRMAKNAGAAGDWFNRNLERIWKNLVNKGTQMAERKDLLEAARLRNSGRRELLLRIICRF